jgi:hypothetical protein
MKEDFDKEKLKIFKSLVSSCSMDLTGATGDAERTKDRQTCRKLGLGVLGAWMKTHNNLVASFLY